MSRLTVAAFAFALLAASPARAAEGVLPVRAGDTVSGVLRFCGDRHMLRTDLVRGERLRLRVATPDEFTSSVTVRVFDPTGLEINERADVREAATGIVVGPFKAALSGGYLVQIATFSRHDIAYEARASVRRKSRRSVRLGGKRRAAEFVAAAGSTFRVKRLRGAPVLEMAPPTQPWTVLAPEALREDGLTAPRGGRYALRLAEGGGRLRLVVRAPKRAASANLEFPVLPRGAVADWYPGTGWILRPGIAAPDDGDAPVSVPGAVDPLPGPAEPYVSVTEAPGAPSSPVAAATLSDPSAWDSALSGVGLPMSPAPTLDEVRSLGRVVYSGGAPQYVFDVDRDGFGALTYRVSFLVGGVPSLAPVVIDGRVTMSWQLSREGTYHQANWTLTFDADRGVQVLEGSETVIASHSRTVSSSASAFVLPTAGGVPAGVLSWGVSAPGGTSISRSETYDGIGSVTVQVAEDGATGDPVVFAVGAH